MLTLPVVHIVADTLPEAWEKAVVETWRVGVSVRTQYDKPDDPPSKDAIAVIVVREPFKEPRIHRALPCGLAELEIYCQEVIHGIHDHWIDPSSGKWEYTYHERLRAYSVPGMSEPIDQLSYIIDSLAKTPHTRRAQAITWKVWVDTGIEHPPCLQRIWVRVIGDELVMNVHMRSNDAFKAAFMNMYAFTELQKVIAERLSERLEQQIRVGQYTHIADSFHIYGAYFDEFQRFLETLQRRTFEQRTYRTEEVLPIFEEAREAIKRSLEEERISGRKGI